MEGVDRGGGGVRWAESGVEGAEFIYLSFYTQAIMYDHFLR